MTSEPAGKSAAQTVDAESFVYKIVPRDAWRAACARGQYLGSEHDARDGFIHLSTAGQVSGTLVKHFSGQADLLLVAFDKQCFGSALRYEPSRGGDLFPHLYSALQTSFAVWATPIRLQSDGSIDCDRELFSC